MLRTKHVPHLFLPKKITCHRDLSEAYLSREPEIPIRRLVINFLIISSFFNFLCFNSTADDASLKASSRKVTVDRPDNITFTSFFESVDAKRKSETSDISIDDFDSVARQTEALLVQKRTVRVQRRREASKNPIKALAARPDVKDEYTEVITGIAEREKHRLNIEKCS